MKTIFLILLFCLPAAAQIPMGFAVKSRGKVWPMDQIWTFSGTANDLVTTTMLTNGSIGTNTGFSWSASRTPEHTRLQAGGTTPFMRREPLSASGAGTYTGGGYSIIRFDLAEAQTDASTPRYETLTRAFPAIVFSGNFTMTGLVKFNASGGSAGTRIDIFKYQGTSVNPNYAVAQLRVDYPSGNRWVVAHGSITGGSSSFGNWIAIDNSSVYSITAHVDYSAAQNEVLVVNNETGAVVGHSIAETDANNDPVSMVTQDYLLQSTWANTGGVDVGLVGMDYTYGAFPLETLDGFPVTSLVAEQSLSGQVSLEWAGVASKYLIERNVDSGGWATLTTLTFRNGDAVRTSNTYTDTTVSDGSVYQYRISGVIGDVYGTSATSSAITIDNAAAPDAVDNFNGYANLSSLPSSATWTNCGGAFIVSKPAADGACYNTGTLGAVYYDTGTWSGDQQSQISLETVTTGSATCRMGVAVRCQSGATTYYSFTAQTKTVNRLELAKVNAGTKTSLGTNDTFTFAAGDLLKLTATGSGSATRLTAQIYNAGAWTTVFSSIDPGGTYIDNGYPGMAAENSFFDSTGPKSDDWKGWSN